MNQLTRSFAAEWAQDKIRVNCVAPGVTRTDMASSVCTEYNYLPLLIMTFLHASRYTLLLPPIHNKMPQVLHLLWIGGSIYFFTNMATSASKILTVIT